MNTHATQNTTRDVQDRTPIDSGDREQVLLDDLRHEVSRLADAVERQNELLEAEQSAPQVDR